MSKWIALKFPGSYRISHHFPLIVFDLLRDLLKPENRVILVVLGVLLSPYLVYLVCMAWQRRLTPKNPFFEVAPAANSKSRRPASLYRKVLYVKVTYLSDRAKAAAPFYNRTVQRLEESERAVPVFDEAVYYTLELLPATAPVGMRKDRSSGVVDSRVVIPWQDEVIFRDAGASQLKGFIQLEPDTDSDTFLSVSHFENGLQGKSQDMCTDVPQDAEYVRLIVDFSSVPNSARFISADRATVSLKEWKEAVPITRCGPGLFSVVCKDVKKNSVITMFFTFDWSRAV